MLTCELHGPCQVDQGYRIGLSSTDRRELLEHPLPGPQDIAPHDDDPHGGEDTLFQKSSLRYDLYLWRGLQIMGYLRLKTGVTGLPSNNAIPR